MNKKSSNAIRAQNRLYFILIDFIYTKVTWKFKEKTNIEKLFFWGKFFYFQGFF